jgi:hypothetical protein
MCPTVRPVTAVRVRPRVAARKMDASLCLQPGGAHDRPASAQRGRGAPCGLPGRPVRPGATDGVVRLAGMPDRSNAGPGRTSGTERTACRTARTRAPEAPSSTGGHRGLDTSRLMCNKEPGVAGPLRLAAPDDGPGVPFRAVVAHRQPRNCLHHRRAGGQDADVLHHATHRALWKLWKSLEGGIPTAPTGPAAAIGSPS